MWQDALFCALLVSIVCMLFENSLNGTFIWDDRAAVVKNGDVLQTTDLYELLFHDFWGTDISREDSHKSYRPVTVATFRFDHSVYGLEARGFHITNTLIYCVVVISTYFMLSQYLSPIGARIAALLFACHPVHIEAVSSIVGRADSLCGLFYSLAVLSYSAGVGASQARRYASSALLTLGAIVCAALATLSKEVGYTVVGVFVVLEVVERLKARREEAAPSGLGASVRALLDALWRCVTSVAFLLRFSLLVGLSMGYFALRARLHGGNFVYKWTIMENHVHHLPTLRERALSYAQYHAFYLWKLVYPAHLCFDYGFSCVSTVHSLFDALNWRPLLAYSLLMALIVYSVRHLRVNLLLGLALLLVPLTPALNIFVPVGVLVAERLLFIPSIGFCVIAAELLTVDLRWLWELVNAYMMAALPFLWVTADRGKEEKNGRAQGGENGNRDARGTASGCSEAKQGADSSPTKSKSVSFASPNKKKSGNAEQKKQQKHKGVGSDQALANNCPGLGVPRASSVTVPLSALSEPVSPISNATLNVKKSSNSNSNSNSGRWAYLLVLPVLVLYSLRVLSRNADWRDEFSLYRSGLQVCPRSLKVLTNYALLAMARGQVQEGLDAALRAVEIYPKQVAALVNAGVAYQKLGRFGESVDMFKRCLEVNPTMTKAVGYMGVSYFHWAEVQSDSTAATLLRREALQCFERAIQEGFQAPNILHLTGSTLIELNRKEDSIVYYEAALRQSANYAAYYQHKGVPMLLEDDISPLNTLNQLGSVYWALGNVDQAVDAFQRGLQVVPDSIPVLTNLGNIYRELGDTDGARRMMEQGIRVSGEATPPALYNNLGLLELNAGHFAVSMGLFAQALRALEREQALGDGGSGETSVGSSGSGAEGVIRANIQRAQEGLRAM